MKKLFIAQFSSLLNSTKFAIAFILMLTYVSNVSAQRISREDSRPATAEQIEESFAAAPDCVPKDVDVAGNSCIVTTGYYIQIAAPAPYQDCKLDITYDESVCGGTINVYNAEFDFTPGCAELEKALDDLASDPIKQNILLRSIYTTIGKVLANELANDVIVKAADPFVFECGTPKKVISVNYYEGGCVANYTGFKITNGKKIPVKRQVLCDKSSCCITTSVFCAKNGELQPPTVTQKSEGNGITCDGGTAAQPPKLQGVVWNPKPSPCFSTCGSK